MRGLLEKDLCILKQRRSFFLCMLIVSVILAFNAKPTFVIGYLTLLCSIFSISTLNYDEFDNCYSFLMTLPIDEKIYVFEKFVFGFLMGVAAYIFSSVVTFLALTSKGSAVSLGTMLIENLIYICIGLFFIALNLPIQLKFGQEKSRIVLIAIVGVVCAVFYLLQNFLGGTGIGNAVSKMQTSNISEELVLGITIVITAVLVAISAKISISVMQKKEY